MTPHEGGALGHHTLDAARKIECPRQATAPETDRSGSRAHPGSKARETPPPRERFELIQGDARESLPGTGQCDFCCARTGGGFAFEARAFTMSLDFPSYPNLGVPIEARWWCACLTCADYVWSFDWATVVDRHCGVGRVAWSPWRRQDLNELFDQLHDALTGRWCTWSMAGAA